MRVERRVKTCAAIARAYDVVVSTMNEPARSLKAVLLPMVMAPKAVVRTPVRTVAGTGQLSLSSTREKKEENGVALSRAEKR